MYFLKANFLLHYNIWYLCRFPCVDFTFIFICIKSYVLIHLKLLNEPNFELQVWFDLFSNKRTETCSFREIFCFWKFGCFDVYIKTFYRISNAWVKWSKNLSKVKDTRSCFTYFWITHFPFQLKALSTGSVLAANEVS